MSDHGTTSRRREVSIRPLTQPASLTDSPTAATIDPVLPGDMIAHLRRRRRSLRIRQIDLADRIGTSVSALGRWERRKQRPCLGAFIAWIEELGLELTMTDWEDLPSSSTGKSDPP